MSGGGIPPRFLDELRERLTLSDVIGRRLRVIRAGREFKACCPFHHEKTPSFTINDQKGFWYCFGCGAHGDVVGFTMRHDNLSFPEAVELLAAAAGLQAPQASPEDRRRAMRARDLGAVVEAAAKWFEARLADPVEGAAALAYLRDRGVSDLSVAGWRLGWAPPGGQALARHLAETGFAESDAIEAGVLRRDDDGRAWSFFRRRVILPICDGQGRVVGFGGRILGEGEPKYLNSPDTPLFDKGALLFGLHRARAARAVTPGAAGDAAGDIDGDGADQGGPAGDPGPVILAEGYFDVIALHGVGFRRAVAPLGTAVGEGQMLRLWKLAAAGTDGKPPVAMLDGDDAGRRAMTRLIDRMRGLFTPDRTLRFALLPEGQDPDSVVRSDNGAALIAAALESAGGTAEYAWAALIAERDLTTPEARAKLTRDVRAWLSELTDHDLAAAYRADFEARLAALLGVAVSLAPPPPGEPRSQSALRRPRGNPAGPLARAAPVAASGSGAELAIVRRVWRERRRLAGSPAAAWLGRQGVDPATTDWAADWPTLGAGFEDLWSGNEDGSAEIRHGAWPTLAVALRRGDAASGGPPDAVWIQWLTDDGQRLRLTCQHTGLDVATQQVVGLAADIAPGVAARLSPLTGDGAVIIAPSLAGAVRARLARPAAAVWAAPGIRALTALRFPGSVRTATLVWADRLDEATIRKLAAQWATNGVMLKLARTRENAT